MSAVSPWKIVRLRGRVKKRVIPLVALPASCRLAVLGPMSHLKALGTQAYQGNEAPSFPHEKRLELRAVFKTMTAMTFETDCLRGCRRTCCVSGEGASYAPLRCARFFTARDLCAGIRSKTKQPLVNSLESCQSFHQPIGGGAVAIRLRRRTSDQTVLGSNPAVAAALSPWTRLFTQARSQGIRKGGLHFAVWGSSPEKF